MTDVISGYILKEQIYNSLHTVVYRAVREEDGLSVVLKILKAEFATENSFKQFREEFTLTQQLSGKGIIQALALESWENSLVMVLEDIGATSLLNIIKSQPLELPLALKLAIRIVDILMEIYQQNVIHKDINPSNIIWNPQTDELQIIDYGIATRLLRHSVTLQPPVMLEGTLAYISPEQTGRMNRVMDYRTDQYSLGVTLYQLFTHTLPFDFDDSLEVLHAHLARSPKPPDQVNPILPKCISDIVMKLMSKTAEDRYQSYYGLKSDLERCLEFLNHPTKLETIEIGKEDFTDLFQISQTLYGREKEIDYLLHQFHRVADGEMQLVLVKGYSGTGKTSLIREVHKPMTALKGTFIEGKFDQYQQDMPYAAWIQAFESLVGHWLMETDEDLKFRKKELLKALKGNGKVITDIIPSLELIIGKQPDVVPLEGQERHNRFNYLFQCFIKEITKGGRPLIVFLDDLQWIDLASLNLLKFILEKGTLSHLMIIGAYRDNEVQQDHRLGKMIKQLGHNEVETLSLNSLTTTDVSALIADTLKTSKDNIQEVSELIYSKTAGNAFFIHRLLQRLYEVEAFCFEISSRRWCWDIVKLRGMDISDNVVELILEKIKQLPVKLQTVLKYAGSIGNHFDIAILRLVVNLPKKELEDEIFNARREGLFIPLNTLGQFKFSHDRIQQASYLLIKEEERSAIHWKIGQLLLNNLSIKDFNRHLFEVVNQLIQGRSHIKNEKDRKEVVRLLFIAGERAISSTAFDPAYQFCSVGVELLKSHDWDENYSDTLAYYTKTTEAALLSIHIKEMEQLGQVIIEKATSVLDTIKVFELKVRAYAAQSEMPRAIQVALEGLRCLHLDIAEHPTQTDIGAEVESIFNLTQDIKISEITNLPQMNDPEKLAQIRLLSSIIAPTYNTNPFLMVVSVLKMVQLSIRYGNTPTSSVAYGMYGLLLCGMFGKIDEGYQFGQLSLQVQDKLGAEAVKARTIHIFNAFIRAWKEPVGNTLPALQEAYQIAFITGDFEFVAHASHVYAINAIFSGAELNDIEQEMKDYSMIMKQLGQKDPYLRNQLIRQFVLNLIGKNPNGALDFKTDVYDEDQMFEMHRVSNDISGMCVYYLLNMILFCVFEKTEKAVEYAEKAESYLHGLTGLLFVPTFYFFDSLARLGSLLKGGQEGENETLKKVRGNQEKMKEWVTHSPKNFSGKFYLIEAILAQVKGDFSLAEDNYELAISNSQNGNMISEEALINELYAKYWIFRNRDKIARVFMKDAIALYMRWGAIAKVESLKKLYPHWLSVDQLSEEKATSTTHSHSVMLDIRTVLKSSRVIAGEIQLEKLLSKMMHIIFENAGAEKGWLLLEKNEKWYPEIEVKTTENGVEIFDLSTVEEQENTLLEISQNILNYVVRTQKNVVLSDAANQGDFIRCPQITSNQSLSILALPLINHKKIIGIWYLENNLVKGAFTEERLQLLEMLASQSAISIENAMLYGDMEDQIKKRTQELNEKNKTISQQNKQRQELLHILCHDLINPIGAAHAITEHLVRELGVENTALELLNASRSSLTQSMEIIKLTQKLMALDEKKLNLEIHKENLKNLLNLSLEVVSLRFQEKQINLKVEVQDTVTVQVDAVSFVNSVINNLLTNAAKFSEPSGEVLIQATQDEAGTTLMIQDFGIGMPEKLVNRIFDPTAKTSRPGTKGELGTGFGMPLVKRFVEEYGGTISVVSKEKKEDSTESGTIVKIWLKG